MRGLTGLQLRYVEYMRVFRSRHGRFPTCREMADHFGVSLSVVRDKLNAIDLKSRLVLLGLLDDPRRAEALPAGQLPVQLQTWDVQPVEGGAVVRVPCRPLSFKEMEELSLELDIVAEELQEERSCRT